MEQGSIILLEVEYFRSPSSLTEYYLMLTVLRPVTYQLKRIKTLNYLVSNFLEYSPFCT